MKTRTRTFIDSINNKEELSPMLKWGFIVVLLYSFIGAIYGDNNPEMYTLGLFFIFPIFAIFYGIGNTFFKKLDRKNIIIITVAGFWFLLLAMFMFTGWNGFLGLIILYSFFIFLIRYIISLDTKYKLKKILFIEQANNRNIFKKYLNDNNFLNHHNYFHSPKIREIYKIQSRKISIKRFIINTSIIPIFILLGGIEGFIDGTITWQAAIGVFVAIFGIIVVAQGLAYIIKSLAGKNQIQEKSLYHAKIDVKSNIRYKNKIFFY